MKKSLPKGGDFLCKKRYKNTIQYINIHKILFWNYNNWQVFKYLINIINMQENEKAIKMIKTLKFGGFCDY